MVQVHVVLLHVTENTKKYMFIAHLLIKEKYDADLKNILSNLYWLE